MAGTGDGAAWLIMQIRLTRRVIEGRALKGSQRQLQDYVNRRPDLLSKIIIENLPSDYRSAQIRWISPLEEENYREYRDAFFLEKLGLDHLANSLAGFWPRNGPSWDGLGVLDSDNFRNVLLVEAKSHVPELFSGGCKATPDSLTMITSAVMEARNWYGINDNSNWLGPLYQSANRLTHLYFFRQRMNVPAWLVNVYFIDDPYRPTSMAEWDNGLAVAKSALGITRPLEHTIDVYVPAFECLGESDA